MSELFTTLMEKARGTQKITLRKLGELVGCTPSFLSEVENGVRPVPKDHDFLTRLAKVLNLDPIKVIESAERERVARNPKRLRDLFKNHELAACYYRINESNVTDEQLCQALMKALRELEEQNKDA